VIEYRRVTTSDLDKFLEFMDGPAFSSQPQWAGCYCQSYLNKPGCSETPEENRVRAIERIASGVMQGYLAIDTSRKESPVVGWMAANKNNNFQALPTSDDKTATIICFVIQDSYQNQGVASGLLDCGVSDLRSRGFTSIQAAPLASNTHVDYGYRGKLSMFEKLGFLPLQQIDDKHLLVVKDLS
jgi:ribosomal protein S18 acetylase RimI-like enzyme